jgi:protein CpxP
MSLLLKMRPLVFVATLVCAYPLIALADPGAAALPGAAGDGPPHMHGMDGCAMIMHEGGHDRMHEDGPWHGHGGMAAGLLMFGEGGPLPPHLKALHLSEAQQDKIFAIMHTAAPQAREQIKALRKAHAALRELATSAKYDDGKAKALADALARSVSEGALLHARTHHQLYEVLTPEQREMLERHAMHHDGAAGHDGAAHEHGHHESAPPVAPQQ